MAAEIEVIHVYKSFKDVHAVRGISFSIAAGEFTALLGPNGAGKTTTVEMMEGLRKPDSGQIFLKGKTWQKEERALRRIIGLSLQETRFTEKLTVGETLRLFASFYELGRERAQEMMTLTGLESKQHARVGALSGGQRQRLALAVALLNRPQILFLDEPTTGLDPHSRLELWTILRRLKDENQTTLVLTTHYMEEAEWLCDRIIIIDEGRILRDGHLTTLLHEGGVRHLDELFIQLTGKRLDANQTLLSPNPNETFKK
jgi:ABC-2 type transport system ATP-binding protein